MSIALPCGLRNSRCLGRSVRDCPSVLANSKNTLNNASTVRCNHECFLTHLEASAGNSSDAYLTNEAQELSDDSFLQLFSCILAEENDSSDCSLSNCCGTSSVGLSISSTVERIV